MRMFRIVLTIALLALPAAVHAQQQPPKDTDVASAISAFFNAWNIHDVTAMTSFWADDATLINPAGRTAHGTADIHSLFSEEQSTVFKNSTAKVIDLHVTRWIDSNTAFCDGNITVDNAVAPDGTTLPQLKMHLATLMKKEHSRWLCAEARPYAFQTMASDSTQAH